MISCSGPIGCGQSQVSIHILLQLKDTAARYGNKLRGLRSLVNEISEVVHNQLFRENPLQYLENNKEQISVKAYQFVCNPQHFVGKVLDPEQVLESVDMLSEKGLRYRAKYEFYLRIKGKCEFSGRPRIYLTNLFNTILKKPVKSNMDFKFLNFYEMTLQTNC